MPRAATARTRRPRATKPAPDVSPEERIRFHELVARIQGGAITQDDIGRYFVPDFVGSHPFAPGVKINEATVDIAGVEETAAATGPALGSDAMRAIRSRATVATAARARSGVRAAAAGSAAIIAEGDSWFDLPAVFYPPTAIDVLSKTVAVANLARHGDELRDMIAAGQYVRPLLDGGVRHFLFSGGGNDLLGDLATHLRQRASGDSDPDNAPRYVRPSFEAALDTISGLFTSLARQVRNHSPRTTLYVHGYDYAIPHRFGNWLGKALVFRGFDPVHQKPLADAIIRFMIDAHNARLARLARANENFVHVNLCGLLGPGDWFGDELHPGKSGAEKIAAAFRAAMAEREPMS